MWLFLCFVCCRFLKSLCGNLHKHMETDLGFTTVLEDLFLGGNPPLWGPTKVNNGRPISTRFSFSGVEEKKKNKLAREKIFMSTRKSREKTHWDIQTLRPPLYFFFLWCGGLLRWYHKHKLIRLLGLYRNRLLTLVVVSDFCGLLTSCAKYCHSFWLPQNVTVWQWNLLSLPKLN